MKYCPKCQRNYTDETLKFCLQDGTPLLKKSNKTDDIPMVTLQEQETVVSSRKPEQLRFELGNSQERNRENSQAVTNPAIQPEPQKSNTLIIVLLTTLITLVLLGFAGIAAYFYLNGKDSEVAKTSNVSTNKSNSKNTVSETPQKEKTPKPTPKPEKTPASEIDLEKIKQGVSSRIFSWKAQVEAINLDGYMDNYADKIDYYNKKGVSKSFVRNDKQKAFNKYDSIKVNLSNIVITASKDGQKADVVFDKAWDFSGEESDSSGKVRQQLKMEKSGDTWLITSEKDLKVYDDDK